MLARAAAPLLLALALTGCGGSGDPAESNPTPAKDAASAKQITRNSANASTTLTIASKNFTEEFILGEIYAQALEAGGYKIRKRLDLGSEKVAFARGQERPGRRLPRVHGHRADDVLRRADRRHPQGRAAGLRPGARRASPKESLTALPPTPFTDSNAVGMTQARAQELGIKTISDLKAKASRLTLSGSKECRTRTDCKLGLERVYGLRFKRFLATELEDRHTVLTEGRADVSIVFSTDGQIAADDLLVLEDDRKLFPPYNVSLIVNDKAAKAAGPDLPKIVAQVQQDLSTKVMQELNSRVDLDKEKPAAVARAYLEQFGYVTPAAG